MIVSCPFKQGSWCVEGDPRIVSLEECLECPWNQVKMVADQNSTKPGIRPEFSRRHLYGLCHYGSPCICAWCGAPCDCGELLCAQCLLKALVSEYKVVS